MNIIILTKKNWNNTMYTQRKMYKGKDEKNESKIKNKKTNPK